MAAEKSGRCVIICAAPGADTDFIKSQIRQDDYVICADGGYKYAELCALKPDLYVGDHDSFDGSIDDAVGEISLNTAKDDTDTMHCAGIAVQKGFKEVVLLAAVGARLDHTYANLSVLQYLSSNKITAEILSKNETIKVAHKGVYDFVNSKGSTFSVFPFGCREVLVSYIGDVEYPGKNLTLKSENPVGISNVFKSDSVGIEVLEGCALIITQKRV